MYLAINTMGIFERNEYIPNGNELVPYELNWTSFATQILLNLMEINWILKIIIFGSGLFKNDGSTKGHAKS